MKAILRSIKFVGFQSENIEASVRFSETQTSIIYGYNGSGKTTLLKLIHAVLSKDNAQLIKERVRKVIVEYVTPGDELSVVTVELIEDRAGGQGIISSTPRYDWSQYENSSLAGVKSLSLGVDRSTSVKPAKIDGSDIFPYVFNSKLLNGTRTEAQEFSDALAAHLSKQSIIKTRVKRFRNDNLLLNRDHAFLQGVNVSNIESLLVEKYNLARTYASEQIQKALFDTLALVIDTDEAGPTELTYPDDLGSQIAVEKERIIEALNEGAENKFRNRIVNILSGMNTNESYYPVLKNKVLAQLFWNVLKELKFEKQLLDSINTFVDTFNGFLGEHKSLRVDKDGVFLTVRGQDLSVDALSSGERHLFTFLALVVTDARERDFLIIDEPEISLNADWQRSLVSLLENLAPDTQIILASHSPILANGRPGALVSLEPTEIQNV
ncbi:AAA family ATPase [Pseudomonas thivervalensis]|uniref:AAA family ATPase n=1 Tax=Pseudomonas thivervalensis TaxID=86265 RepID=UPI00069D69EC|nr:AAA family ATPase [Pseudomonas thivervalensis]